MSDVVQLFPDNSYNWFNFSQSLAAILDKQNFSSEFQAILLKRMEVVFKEFDFSYSIKINLPVEHLTQFNEQVDSLAKLLQQRTTKLLISRLILEIELAQSQGYQ